MFVGKEETGEVECNREDSDMTLRKSPTSTEMTSILARVITLKRFFLARTCAYDSLTYICVWTTQRKEYNLPLPDSCIEVKLSRRWSSI